MKNRSSTWVLNCAYPSWARKRVTRLPIHATRGITLGQIRHNPRRELLHLNSSIGSSLLIIQEHVHILDTIGQSPAAPFHLVEEELALKTAGDFESRSSIVRRDSVGYKQLPLYLGLDS